MLFHFVVMYAGFNDLLEHLFHAVAMASRAGSPNILCFQFAVALDQHRCKFLTDAEKRSLNLNTGAPRTFNGFKHPIRYRGCQCGGQHDRVNRITTRCSENIIE
ncbi:MAG: hypothetical protein P8K08_00850 [Fuerstiella sp.]|nr:hypothetical protein [Fuerstiella sp.]